MSDVDPNEIAKIEDIIKNNIRENADILDMDEKDIEKYNKRREELESFKDDIKKAEAMSNKDWAQTLLRHSVKNMMISQKIATDHIEEGFETRTLTSVSEISNALTTALKTVIDIDHQEEHLKIAKEKINISRAKLEDGVLDTSAKRLDGSIGTGTTSDMLAMVKKGLPVSKETT